MTIELSVGESVARSAVKRHLSLTDLDMLILFGEAGCETRFTNTTREQTGGGRSEKGATIGTVFACR